MAAKDTKCGADAGFNRCNAESRILSKCNLLFIKYMVRFINKALYQPLNRTVSVCPGGKSYIGVNYSGKTYMEGSCNGTI